MQNDPSKIIVKKDKDCLVIFSLDTSCNKGFIWCNDLGFDNNTLMSGGEASYDYYLGTKPANEEETAHALVVMQNSYPDETFETKKRITETDRKNIWAH